MTDLFLSILASTGLFVIFKYFQRHNINTLHAIVINYFTAASVGYLSYSGDVSVQGHLDAPWIIGVFILGFLFISVFNVMGLTSQRHGLSVASVAGKMSVIIPILFSVFFYRESLSTFQILGIVLALVSVYLTATKAKGSYIVSHNLLLPILLFVGSGVIDTFLKYLETTTVSKNDVAVFSAAIFIWAGVLGLVFSLFLSKNHKFSINLKTVLGGITLGVVNYFSLFYLIRAFQYRGMESAAVFTINNVGIVGLTTVLGLVLFQEKLSRSNWTGIVLAAIAIVMVSMF